MTILRSECQREFTSTIRLRYPSGVTRFARRADAIAARNSA